MLTKLILMFILGFGVAFSLMMLVVIRINYKEDDDFNYPTDEEMDQMYIEAFFEENNK